MMKLPSKPKYDDPWHKRERERQARYKARKKAKKNES